ncbi:MAG: response regulator [bacterium]|nr:response regulator [bacterium]
MNFSYKTQILLIITCALFLIVSLGSYIYFNEKTAARKEVHANYSGVCKVLTDGDMLSYPMKISNKARIHRLLKDFELADNIKYLSLTFKGEKEPYYWLPESCTDFECDSILFSYPIYYFSEDLEHVGRLEICVKKKFSFDNYGAILFFLFFTCVIVAFSAYIFFKGRHLAQIQKIAQMFAHDVKKPMAIIENISTLISKASGGSKIQAIIHRHKLELNKAKVKVGSMREDLLLIGRKGKISIHIEPVSPNEMISTSINESCSIYHNADIKFIYNFKHKHMINVDRIKMERVFSNIITNGMEAMKLKGELRFCTKEDHVFTTFSIENTGSYIPRKDFKSLFKEFYSKNKTGGTGLGLAIVEKVVTAHGGRIWCESSKENKTVKFSFTVPTTSEAEKIAPITATCTKNIIEGFNKMCKNNKKKQPDALTAQYELEFENKILEYIEKTKGKIIIGLIENDPVCRKALIQSIREYDSLKSFIEFKIFQDFNAITSLFKKDPTNLLICDSDLGSTSIDGFEVTRMLRASGINTPIYMLSDNFLQINFEKTIDAGAQGFMYKPLTRVHLLRFISDFINTEEFNIVKNGNKLPTVAVLDDMEIFIEAIDRSLNDAFCSGFSSCEDFLGKIEANPTLLSTFDGIITDRNFERKIMEGDELSLMKGEELVSILRKKYNYKKPIMFNTMDEMDESELDRCGAAMNLGKENNKNWAQLEKLCD